MLGKLIEGKGERDAIHVAIAPMTAKEKLHPGQHVGADGSSQKPWIGIVDPFLTHPVCEGERFYAALYPNTVTSLRHAWSHPAFEDEQPEDTTDKKAESKAWIEAYAKEVGVGYDELMQAAKDYVEYGEYWNEGERFDGEYVPDEFWDHYQIVTGTFVEGKGSFFSCSC